MTQVSTVYDALETLIEGELSGYGKLPNPYDPENNSGLLLDKGYGIAFGPGVNTERYVNCKITIERVFSIPLVNVVVATENDTDRHATLEKTIQEDAFKIIKALENDSRLGGAAVKARYSDDSGVLFLEGDREKYLLQQLEVAVEYFEDLS